MAMRAQTRDRSARVINLVLWSWCHLSCCEVSDPFFVQGLWGKKKNHVIFLKPFVKKPGGEFLIVFPAKGF